MVAFWKYVKESYFHISGRRTEVEKNDVEIRRRVCVASSLKLPRDRVFFIMPFVFSTRVALVPIVPPTYKHTDNGSFCKRTAMTCFTHKTCRDINQTGIGDKSIPSTTFFVFSPTSQAGRNVPGPSIFPTHPAAVDRVSRGVVLMMRFRSRPNKGRAYRRRVSCRPVAAT